MAHPTRDLAKQFITAAIINCDAQGNARDVLDVPRQAVLEAALTTDNAAEFVLDTMSTMAFFAASLAHWAAHASECMAAAEVWQLMVDTDNECEMQ